MLICNIRFQEVYTHTSLDSTNIQMVLRVALWIRHCRLFICIMLTHGENKLDPSGDDFKRNISQVRLVGREARVCILQINNPHLYKNLSFKRIFSVSGLKFFSKLFTGLCKSSGGSTLPIWTLNSKFFYLERSLYFLYPTPHILLSSILRRECGILNSSFWMCFSVLFFKF